MQEATVQLPSENFNSTRPPAPVPVSVRLASIDAYRGFVMFLMMAEVLSFGDIARSLPGSSFWQFLAHEQTHAEWIGCSLHDLIQPSFSFLVGVALTFSLANRAARGQSRSRMTFHAFSRALILILLGVFLRSLGQSQTYWTFEDTLTQIGLGYGFLYILGWQSVRAQWIAFAGIVIGYWAAFGLYPLPPAGFDTNTVGVPPSWPHWLTGWAAHWNKNTNLAWAADTHFLNWFSREKPFVFNEGGYCTLSFIPTLATMILGLIAGGILRSDRPAGGKVKWLVVAGFIGLAAGVLLDVLGICPVVKRIWTPAWVFFSGGWCCLLLASFYTLVDLKGRKAWVFPLIVIGMNSIAAYCMAHLMEDFVAGNLLTHLGQNAFKILGPVYEPLVRGVMVLLVFWLILLWLYRRKIFLRI
jgi:predicted acyltransferase